jgi:hypothetical protein
MKSPASVSALETLGRVRLSPSFFMRDFLYSEIANHYGMPNIPDDPDLAIAAGRALCENLLEPLQDRFGRISIRSAYRSPSVNRIGNENGHSCSRNDSSFTNHIWDRRDAEGYMGAMATIVVNSFIPYYEASGDWQAIGWWVHDHLPYSELQFFNLGWHEKPRRTISSFIAPRGKLTGPGMANHAGDHAALYARWLEAAPPGLK